jgi:diacylglycerol kinase family enzyme
LLGASATPVRVIQLGPGDDLTDLVRRAAAEGSPRVAVAGGDGSMRAAAEGLAGSTAVLVPIPTGTLNNFARRIGIQGVDDGVRRLGSRRVSRVAVGVVNDRIFLNTATFGMYGEVVRRRDRLARWLTRWPAATVAFAHALAGLRWYGVEIETAGVALKRSTPLFGARLVVQGTDGPACLHVAILSVRGRRDLLGFLLRRGAGMVRGEIPAEDPRVELLHAGSFVVGAEGAIDATLDGEPFACRPPLFVALQAAALRVPADAGGEDAASSSPPPPL